MWKTIIHLTWYRLSMSARLQLFAMYKIKDFETTETTTRTAHVIVQQNQLQEPEKQVHSKIFDLFASQFQALKQTNAFNQHAFGTTEKSRLKGGFVLLLLEGLESQVLLLQGMEVGMVCLRWPWDSVGSNLDLAQMRYRRPCVVQASNNICDHVLLATSLYFLLVGFDAPVSCLS